MRRFFNFIKNLLILAIMDAAVVNYHEQIQTFLLEAADTASTYLEQKGLKSKTLDLSGGIVAESNEKVTKNTTGYRGPTATAKVYIGVKQTDLYNATDYLQVSQPHQPALLSPGGSEHLLSGKRLLQLHAGQNRQHG